MSNLRSNTKTAFLFLAYCLRPLYRIAAPKKEVAVLMYHSVEDNENWKYGVSPRVFARQFAYLVKNKTIVSLDDIVDYVHEKRELSDGSVALTFDDGYDDTYSVVFPLIKKYNAPITVFLTTDLSVMSKLGNLPRLQEPQIKEMAESGLVRFEVHGHRHANLTELSVDAGLLSDEILTSKKEIKRMANQDSAYVAYASGHKNGEVISFLREHDFTAGFAITEGLIEPGTNPFLIKRIQVDRTMNFAQFIMRLTRAVDINRTLVALFRKKS